MWGKEWHWTGSPSEAIKLQKEIAKSVELKPLEKDFRYIAGFDCSFIKRDNEELIIAGGIIWDVKEKQAVASASVVEPVKFPYVPGLLAFREMPALTKLTRELPRPDIIMADGHGIAHPRRAGIATHLGIWFQIPSIGVAKTKLIGHYQEPAQTKGSYTILFINDRPVGIVLRSRDKVKPIFISPGHLIDIDSALLVVMKCLGKYRLPEPTRLAHHLVSHKRKELKQVQRGK